MKKMIKIMESIDFDDIDRGLTGEQFAEIFKNKIGKNKISLNQNAYDGGYRGIYWRIEREETDEEYERRLKTEERQKELKIKADKKERELYEQLKKKFGDK